jgi:hypothetical protein
MVAEVRPYFVPALDAVIWETWMMHDGQEWTELPDAVDGWDPATDLHVGRRVTVDPIRFRTETGLDLGAVALVLSWTSSTTDMTGCAPPVSFGADGKAVAEAVLIGERLSGALALRTTISLVRPQMQAHSGVAKIAGSILAEHVQQVVLESAASMFPLHQLDFANTRLSPAASWHLETSTELSAPFYGTFRVLINKRDKELGAAVSRGTKDKRQQALLDDLEAGVSALMLELALNLRDELEERDEWPVNSVGDILLRLLASSGVSTVAPATAHDLADFRTQLSGAVRTNGQGRLFQ